MEQDLNQNKNRRAIVIAVALVFVSLAALFLTKLALNRIQSEVKVEYGESLNAVLATSEAALLFWTEQRKSEALRVAENDIVSTLAFDLNFHYTNGDIEEFVNTQKQSIRFINTIDNLQSNDGFQILSTTGIVLLSSLEDTGIYESEILINQPAAIQKALNGQTTFIPPMQTKFGGPGQQAAVFFLAPIYYENIIVGILASAHYPERELSNIMSLGRLGKSGESYLINSDAKIVSRSRFYETIVDMRLTEEGQSEVLTMALKVPKSIDQQSPLTLAANSVIKYESAQNLNGYPDYRGIDVIGTWKWLPDLNLGIITEIDLNEANKPFYKSRNVIVLLVISNIAIAILMISLVLYMSSRTHQKLLAAANQLDNKVKDRTKELESTAKSLNSERRILQSILDNIPDPIFCKDGDGLYIRINNSFAQLSGRSQSDFLGKSDRDLYTDEEADFFIKDDEKLILTGQSHVVERPVTDAAGNEVLFETRKTLIDYRDDQQPGILGISRDITDRRRFEEAMLNATRTAQEASNAKSEFLARMSHEIRTPMNGVLGMIDLVLDSQLSSEQKHKLKVAKNSASSLLTIINDILDFSRVEAGKLELEQIDFNLGAQVETIAQSLALRCDSKGVELIVDTNGIEQLMVIGDPIRLRQILTNLISNSIKFTERGQIVVRASSKNINDKCMIKCSIEDTGIGIPESKISSLFDSFTQVDSSTTRLYGGSGLGLAICERLVELMDGEIVVESQMGKGSTFTFTLMLKASDMVSKPMPKSDIVDWNVLVVDDNETNLEILESQLKSWQLNTILANSAEDALTILNNDKPALDLIITDMNMPIKDGLTLVGDIKLLEGYQHTKIMMLSSMSFQMSSDEFKSLGLDACLMKPVGSSELFNSIALLSRNEDFISESTLLSYTNSEGLKPIEWPTYHKVLIVEDNPVNQLVAEGLMNKFGLQYGVAVDGKVALSILSESEENQPYTLILMDCQMPVMDGYRATEIIRSGGAGDRYKDIPIIAMTANAMKGDREKCIRYGMNDHVAKPIDTQLLQEALVAGFKLTPETLLDNTLNSSAKTTQQTDASLRGQLIIPEGLSTMDWSMASPSLVNQPAIYIKSLKLFSKHYKETDFSFPNERAEMDDLKSKIHAIKGSAGNIGLTSLFRSAVEIEDKISQNKLVSNDLNKFTDLLHDSMKDLALLIDVNTALSETNSSSRSVKEVLGDIHPLVEKSELVPFELVEELAELEKQVNKDNLDDANLRDIVEALEDFDYEKSKQLIEGIV
jgi:PAS domain S-box-containing protein